MTKLNTYSAKGIKGSTISLPASLVEKINKPLLAQAIRVYESIMHSGFSKTKSRGEIVASTRKIYRQKGTGRARHGSISAPIFVGGGKAHGAKLQKRTLSLSKSQKRKSLAVSLTMKAKEGKLFGINAVSSIKKTKEASLLLTKIMDGKIKRVTFVLDDNNKDVRRFFRNISFVNTIPFSSLNAYQVYKGGTILIDTDALKSEGANKTKVAKKIQTKTKKVSKVESKVKGKTKPKKVIKK